MNKEFIQHNLNEALEQLKETIQDISNKADYDNNEYKLDMEHLYHHINTAWNSRNSTETESLECTETDFRNWRQFPKDFF